MSTDVKNTELASSFKEKGNAAMASRKLGDAVEYYTKAIEYDPDNEVYYSNRSHAYLLLKNYAAAKLDAERCIQINGNWPRGYLRLGTALENLKLYLEAEKWFKKGAEFDPADTEFMNGQKRCRRLFESEKRTEKTRQYKSLPTIKQCLDLSREIVPFSIISSAPKLENLVKLHPLIELKYHPEKGRGLYAISDIPARSPVFFEHAVAWCPPIGDFFAPLIPGIIHTCPFVYAHDEENPSEPRIFASEVVDGILLQLAPFSEDSRALNYGSNNNQLNRENGNNKTIRYTPDSKSYSDPEGKDGVSRAALYASVNALNGLGIVFDESGPEDLTSIVALSPTAALLNHSCLPNSSFSGYWDADNESLVIRIVSEREIKKGEEITISYVERYANMESRREALKRYGFTCQCERCSGTSSALFGTMAGTDLLVSRLEKLNEEIVYVCPMETCHMGRVYDGLNMCVDCGADYEAGNNKSLLEGYSAKRTEWLDHQARGHIVSDEAETCVRSLISESKEADQQPMAVVHPADKGRYNALKEYVVKFWSGDVDLPICIDALEFLLRSQGTLVSGLNVLPDILTYTAHLISMQIGVSKANKTATSDELLTLQKRAIRYYEECLHLIKAQYGEKSGRVGIYSNCLKKLPTDRQSISKVETNRIEGTKTWVQSSNLSKTLYNKWIWPIDLSLFFVQPTKEAPYLAPNVLEFAVSQYPGVAEMHEEVIRSWTPWRED